MSERSRNRKRRMFGSKNGRTTEETANEPAPEPIEIPLAPPVAIPDGDALVPYLIDAAGPVETQGLELDSAALDRLRDEGVEIVVPLVSQGELLGTLNLGRRLSDQPYSTDDRRLLGNLAAQVAPAMRVAQLVKEQEAEAKERERIAYELRIASVIQQTLLPKELPALAGWEVDAFYRPARAVGGDFYDFIDLGDGHLGVVIGDVTDKGVPAALVMATCRSTLRSAALNSQDPGKVLAEVNEALVDEIPENMFVTCLYGILDPSSGELVFANAGHNLPYVWSDGGVSELRATGMPLGLLPGSRYDVKTVRLEAGQTMLLSSDGLVEAHDPGGEMYGFPRLIEQMEKHSGGADMIGALVSDLDDFRGELEQEDDVTFVSVRRGTSAAASASAFSAGDAEMELLDSFSVPSEDGNERSVMDRVAGAVAGLGLSEDQAQRLGTAVSEAAMNAIEHGNKRQAELPVDVEVLAAPDSVMVRVTDHGGGREIPDPETPDLEAKLAGEQTPRGWGLFLIEHMVDELRTTSDDSHHTVELVMNREGDA